MFEAGDTFDRFTVESVLGEGGLAIVYRVRHNMLGSLHALKVLKFQGESIQRRLVLEGQVQASLRHPNIVAVTDVVFVAEQPGLVLEFIDGPSLETWLATNQPALDEAEALFAGILAGVARAHRVGLIHRDLKPGNILLDHTDGVVTPKVTDFGIAKALADEGGRSQTRTGVAMGTPQFMAPEQIRSSKDVDQRADIWALGCILYRMVCGTLPFDHEDIIELYSSIGAGRYVPPEAHAPQLPARVLDAIRGCLMTERDQRIPDCDTLRRVLARPPGELAPVLSSASFSATLPSSTTRDAPWRSPVDPGPAEAAPSGAETILLPDSEPAPAPPPRVAPAAPAAPAPTRSRRHLVLALLGALGLMSMTLGGFAVVLYLSATDGPPSDPVLVEQAAPDPSPAPPEAATTPPAEEPTLPVSVPPAAAPEPIAPATPPRIGATASPAQPTATRVSAARTGRVVVSGTVDKVVLHSGGQSRSVGQVPAGEYTASVTFPGREPIEVGPFEVVAEGIVTLACDAAFVNCAIRK